MAFSVEFRFGSSLYSFDGFHNSDNFDNSEKINDSDGFSTSKATVGDCSPLF